MADVEEKPNVALLDQAMLSSKEHSQPEGHQYQGHSRIEGQHFQDGVGEYREASVEHDKKYHQRSANVISQGNYNVNTQDPYFKQYSNLQVPVFPGQVNRYPVVENSRTDMVHANASHDAVMTTQLGADGQISTAARLSGRLERTCKICNKVLSTPQSLEYHIRTHSGEKPYKCDICGRALSTKQGLKYHMRTHTGEKSFECEICKKPLVTKQSLEYHMRTHSDVKPFKCELCSKSLTTRQGLIYHMGTHTGEKPHKCTKCKRLLVTKQSLDFHMRTHAEEAAASAANASSQTDSMDNTHLIDHLKKYYGDNP